MTIDDYLDGLLVALSDRPRQARELLAEAEAHLRDEAANGVARGLTPEDAEHIAVERFGPIATVAALESRRRLPFSIVVQRGVATALLRGGIGGVAVGISAVTTAILGWVGGARFVIDVQPGQHLAATDCARWMAADHAARTCAQAAIADWAGDVVLVRAFCGVLGVAALVVFVVVRRRWMLLPRTVIDTVAATAFGVAAVVLAAMAIDAFTVNSGHGAGQWLGAAPVALAAAAIYAVRLVRDLRAVAA